jgi:hypothetical protein
LAAYGPRRHAQWIPGTSGGNHARPWPKQVVELLRKRLSSRPPASYSFAASEALRAVWVPTASRPSASLGDPQRPGSHRPTSTAQSGRARLHRNQNEIHRELGVPPQAAWERAHSEKRSVLRGAPRCPWWPYVWSQRIAMRVGADGRVSVGADTLRLEVAAGTRVILCQHPSGHQSVLAHPPERNKKPVVLFTNRPTDK